MYVQEEMGSVIEQTPANSLPPPPRSKAEEMAARLEQDQAGNADAVQDDPTPQATKPPVVDNAAKVAELAKEAAKIDPQGQHGTVKADAPAGAPPVTQQAPATKAPNWNGGPDEKTAYTLAKLKTADGETIAKMAKFVTPAVVGEENYRKIQQAMTAREKELYPPQPEADADPFASDVPPEIQGLTMMLESKSTAADFDDVAKRWAEDSHSISEPTYNAGVVLIQQARVSKGV